MDKENNHSILRKRGRPAGKHRVPLSQNERRARNAQYERERRVETNEALADLAAAIGCKSTMCHSDLLATVITHLERASEIKHSSDLASLRRCNKNLMAQIACLEQRLAEADDDAIQSRPQRAELSRPVKRRRSDCESLDEDSAHLSKCKYSPVSSPEPKYSPEPRSSPELSPPPESYPEDVFCPAPKCSPQSETRVSVPKYSPASECPSPASLMSTHFLPVPKVSPLSDTSDHQPEETVDFSAYRFAGAHLPTPEYQIASEPPYVAPESYHGQVFYGCQSSPLHYPSSPEEETPKHAALETCPDQILGDRSSPLQYPSSSEDFSPPPYMVPEACGSSGLHPGFSDVRVLPPQVQYTVPVAPYAVPISYPGAAAVRPDEFSFMTMHGSSTLPTDSAGFDPRQVGFLSTEDLISVYLSRY